MRLASLDMEPLAIPLGGRAGGSPLLPPATPFPAELWLLVEFPGLSGGGAKHWPFILCGKIGEFVANCEAVTAFVFRVPVLLLVMAFVVFVY